MMKCEEQLKVFDKIDFTELLVELYSTYFTLWEGANEGKNNLHLNKTTSNFFKCPYLFRDMIRDAVINYNEALWNKMTEEEKFQYDAAPIPFDRYGEKIKFNIPYHRALIYLNSNKNVFGFALLQREVLYSNRCPNFNVMTFESRLDSDDEWESRVKNLIDFANEPALCVLESFTIQSLLPSALRSEYQSLPCSAPHISEDDTQNISQAYAKNPSDDRTSACMEMFLKGSNDNTINVYNYDGPVTYQNNLYSMAEPLNNSKLLYLEGTYLSELMYSAVTKWQIRKGQVASYDVEHVQPALDMRFARDSADSEIEIEFKHVKQNDERSSIIKEETCLQKSKLADSGDRTKFTNGAVRELGGKGRCDLIPPSIYRRFIEKVADPNKKNAAYILNDILLFMETKNVKHIAHGIQKVLFELNIDKDPWASTCIQNAEGLLELAKHFEDGAVKYEERNWERGLPIGSYIDSALRHTLKYIAGWNDEPHLKAIGWNLICLYSTINTKPEALNEYNFPISK